MLALIADVLNWTVPLFNEPFCNPEGVMVLCSRFLLNLATVWIIIRYFYYPRGRRNYYFTYFLLSISIFMLIYLMNDSSLEIGAALGLFAVFGIIRYRTESIPIREMTYLFFFVAISVLNGTTAELSFVEHILANVIFIAAAWWCEKCLFAKHLASKFVKYDNMSLIVPEKRAELIADLEKRLGIKVRLVEVGAIDFLADMAMLRVYYDAPKESKVNQADDVLKLNNENFFK